MTATTTTDPMLQVRAWLQAGLPDALVDNSPSGLEVAAPWGYEEVVQNTLASSGLSKRQALSSLDPSASGLHPASWFMAASQGSLGA